MEVSAIIPTYNRKEMLEKNLKVLINFKEIKEVIIVDDGSTDNTFEILKKFSDKLKIKYTKNKVTIGSAYSWNKGISLASKDYILLLNDDTRIIEDNFFEILAEDKEKADIIGPALKNTKYEKINFLYKIRKVLLHILIGDPLKAFSAKPKYVDFVSGVMFSSKKIMAEIGFDEGYEGNCFREESDFQKRAKNRGYKIFYDPRISVLHDQTNEGGQRRFSKEEDKRWRKVNHHRFLDKNYKILRIFWKPLFWIFTKF